MGAYPLELYGGTPPHAPTRTSLEAARRIASHTVQGRAQTLECIQHHRGATCDEVELQTGQKHQSASARIRELVLLGRVQDSGARRPTRSGRRAVVWVVA